MPKPWPAAAFRPLRCRNGQSAGLGLCPQRQFSSMPALGLRATFAETGDSNLDGVLDEIQRKIILPAYLPEKQRNMVFRPKMRTYLERNPIVLEVEGVEHKMVFIDRSKEWKDPRKLFMKALNKMQCTQEWDSLGTLLAGYKKAGIKLPHDVWGKIVRLAAHQSRIHTVIQCAKQVKETGFVLTDREIVVRIFAGINDNIVRRNWDTEKTALAVRTAESVLDLLQRPGHWQPEVDIGKRLHFSQLVRGMTLFARASAATAKQQAGEANDTEVGLLRDEASLFRSLWQDSLGGDLTQVEELAALNPALEMKANPGGTRIPKALNSFTYVQVISQIIKGIAMTREILGQEADDLVPLQNALDEHLKEFAKTLGDRLDRHRNEYKRVTGQQADWTDGGGEDGQSGGG